ncbi:MAG: hypothetical protein KIS78_06565 [Labilithrix sp.]|nr:hypothetical protein [Labilithrix sp.]
MFRKAFLPTLLATVVSMGIGCAAPDQDGEDTDEQVEASQDEIREVLTGPLRKSTDAEVWSVDNAWSDTTTAAAREAGVAWAENSGLTWEEKYQRWVASFEKVDAVRWGKTIRITTPYGRTMDGPVLECADLAIWLRMTFSAWYHLPFYMTGYSNGQQVYYGHFGVVNRDGNPIAGFPRFKALYRDHEKTWTAGERWPSDATLRARHVGADDSVAGVRVGDGRTLAEGDGAGAYFDELFLNKRAGYLMLLLDRSFGSANLADGANLFHITPQATTPGDVLVQRWQRNGIGHTLPVMTAVHTPGDKLRVSTASGSMPRRQPVWEEEAQSASYFKHPYSGGRGTAADGSAYAKLGGGIRRWRTPALQSGRWNNVVPRHDQPVYVEDRNVEGIASRPERFETLLAEDTPEAERDSALATIESARRSLLERPASCAQRTKREGAFEALYDVMSRAYGKSRAEVDAQYRTLEDYVFAELEYNRSKTCCWNTTTPQMAELVLDYAAKEKAANDAAGVCKQPTPFRSSAGGKYDTWKAHAASLGRAHEWRAWSEDEPCAQRGVVEDTIGERGALAMCR